MISCQTTCISLFYFFLHFYLIYQVPVLVHAAGSPKVALHYFIFYISNIHYITLLFKRKSKCDVHSIKLNIKCKNKFYYIAVFTIKLIVSTSSLYCISYVWSTFIYFFFVVVCEKIQYKFFFLLIFLFTYIDKYNIESTIVTCSVYRSHPDNNF